MRNIKKKNEKSLINDFIEVLKKDILKKRKREERLSFVLTGGSSPTKLYKALAKAEINWSNVDLFWGDERFVSKSSKYSNYKLVYDLLIKKIKINNNNLFSFKTNNIGIEKSALKYENDVKRYFNKKKIRFDIFLLGMGNDGHIASIFPYSDELKQKFLIKPIFRKDFKRLTFGLNIINNSNKIFLWLNTNKKTLIFNKLKNKGKKIPVNNLDKRKLFCFSIK